MTLFKQTLRQKERTHRNTVSDGKPLQDHKKMFVNTMPVLKATKQMPRTHDKALLYISHMQFIPFNYLVMFQLKIFIGRIELASDVK